MKAKNGVAGKKKDISVHKKSIVNPNPKKWNTPAKKNKKNKSVHQQIKGKKIQDNLAEIHKAIQHCLIGN